MQAGFPRDQDWTPIWRELAAGISEGTETSRSGCPRSCTRTSTIAFCRRAAIVTLGAEGADVISAAGGVWTQTVAVTVAALARACELGAEADVAAQMYAQCARTDAAYIAPAQFGPSHIETAASGSRARLWHATLTPEFHRAWGAVNSEVVLELAPGIQVVAIITRQSAESLGLAEGKDAYAVVKASSVMVAVD